MQFPEELCEPKSDKGLNFALRTLRTLLTLRTVNRRLTGQTWSSQTYRYNIYKQGIRHLNEKETKFMEMYHMICNCGAQRKSSTAPTDEVLPQEARATAGS